MSRTYHAYDPFNRQRPSPAIVVFGHSDGRESRMHWLMQPELPARDLGFLILYVQALSERFGGFHPEVEDRENMYLDAVLADARKVYGFDPDRLFVVGFAGGTPLAASMACHRSSLFAGLALVEPSAGLRGCLPESAMPTVVIQSTPRPVFMNLGPFEDPLRETMSAYRALAGHSDRGRRIFKQQWARCIQYGSMSSSVPLIRCLVAAENTTWPGGAQTSTPKTKLDGHDFPTSRFLLDFFAKQSPRSETQQAAVASMPAGPLPPAAPEFRPASTTQRVLPDAARGLSETQLFHTTKGRRKTR